jgi:hypothetical protein
MARPKKLTRDPDKKARSFNELQRIHQMAEKLYHLTGGESIDMQIAALDRTQDAYRSQMDAAEMMKSDVGAGAWGPNVNPYEARMTASTAAKLIKLREQKMAHCLLMAEEGAEAEADRVAAEAKGGASEGCPRPSAEGEGAVEQAVARPVAVSGPELPSVPETMKAHSTAKDGDSPQKRGQSPLAGGTPLTALPPRR